MIYFNPSDCPGHYVLRPQRLEGDAVRPMPQSYRAKTLPEIRAYLPKGLFYMPRDSADEPQIVETWF